MHRTHRKQMHIYSCNFTVSCFNNNFTYICSGYHPHFEAVCGACTKPKPKTTVWCQLTKWHPTFQVLSLEASEAGSWICIFREASNIICSYGNRILDVQVLVVDNILAECQSALQVAKDQMYPLKLKGISICFSMLKAALCGSYVNFGVFRSQIYKLNCDFGTAATEVQMFPFRLYGDEALDNALNTFVTLLLSIPQVLSFRFS